MQISAKEKPNVSLAAILNYIVQYNNNNIIQVILEKNYNPELEQQIIFDYKHYNSDVKQKIWYKNIILKINRDFLLNYLLLMQN